MLHHRPVLSHTLKTCLDTTAFSQIIVVVTPGEEELFRRDVLLPWFPHANIVVVTGGKERQDSVRNALDVLADEIEYVCIHDGARPLADKQLILTCLEKVKEHGAVIAAVPVKDTIKTVHSNGQVAATPDRSTLWAVQTPQVFRREWLESAHRAAHLEGLRVTDDAALVEHYGHSVFVVPASYSNLKVTTPEDLILAEALMGRAKSMRIGTGYDVHKLVENRPLILGGVTVPYELGLLGHSDADVLVHAMMDAMLGALALGDIGKHFPDTDPAYKGISSLKLLQHVGELCQKQGYTVGNMDAVIIAQKPKLAPYIPQMQENIAQTLNIPANLISVKATTTEGLGFTGTGEGMAAQATALMLAR